MPQGEFQYCKHYGECDDVTVKVFHLSEELKVKSEELSHADLTNLTEASRFALAAIRMVTRAEQPLGRRPKGPKSMRFLCNLFHRVDNKKEICVICEICVRQKLSR